jgi:phosphoribosylformylglycinamidine synthase subunit PurQ / glutaminase
MMAPRVLVLRTAGINCDEETAYAFRLAGAAPERVHVRAFLDGARRLDEFGALAIPGGFSYGDDLGAGTVLGNQLRTKLADAVADFVSRGKPVIGICNGFQVLVRLGILPGIGTGKTVALIENESGRFEDRWVRMRVETGKCPFLEKGAIVEMPIAHKEGRFVVKDEGVLRGLEEGGQVAFRYLEPAGDARAAGFPANPNGSVAAIAGVINPSGNVLGLMPHPERHVRGLHHPAWTQRASERGLPDDEERAGDGYPIFGALVRAIR